MKKRLSATLAKTRFKEVEMVAIAAKPGQEEGKAEGLRKKKPFVFSIFSSFAMIFFSGLEELISILKRMTRLPDRNIDGALLFSVDHCFNIRGQGTVMTGTVLQGRCI